MTGALMVASLMAAIGLSASGYVFLEMKPGGKPPRRAADPLYAWRIDGAGQGAPADGSRRCSPSPWLQAEGQETRRPRPHRRPLAWPPSPGSTPTRPAASPTSASSPAAATPRLNSTSPSCSKTARAGLKKDAEPVAQLAAARRRGRRPHGHAQPTPSTCTKASAAGAQRRPGRRMDSAAPPSSACSTTSSTSPPSTSTRRRRPSCESGREAYNGTSSPAAPATPRRKPARCGSAPA